MQKPLVVTIEHHSTRGEVMRKLRSGFADIRAQIAPYVSSLNEEWLESGVRLAVTTFGQTIHGSLAVDDTVVRIEVRLPGILGAFGGLIARRIRQRGTALLPPP